MGPSHDQPTSKKPPPQRPPPPPPPWPPPNHQPSPYPAILAVTAAAAATTTTATTTLLEVQGSRDVSRFGWGHLADFGLKAAILLEVGNGLSFLGFIVSRHYLCSDNYGQEEDMELSSIFRWHPVRLDMEIVESRRVLGSYANPGACASPHHKKQVLSGVRSSADAAGKPVGIFR